MTRFFLVVLFSITYPAALLAASANPPPPLPPTNTPAKNIPANTANSGRYKPIQHLGVHRTDPLRTDRPTTTKTQSTTQSDLFKRDEAAQRAGDAQRNRAVDAKRAYQSNVGKFLGNAGAANRGIGMCPGC